VRRFNYSTNRMREKVNLLYRAVLIKLVWELKQIWADTSLDPISRSLLVNGKKLEIDNFISETWVYA